LLVSQPKDVEEVVEKPAPKSPKKVEKSPKKVEKEVEEVAEENGAKRGRGRPPKRGGPAPKAAPKSKKGEINDNKI
jgi:hypothetical protein